MGTKAIVEVDGWGERRDHQDNHPAECERPYAWDVISKITARGDSATPRQAVMLAVALIVCEWGPPPAATLASAW